MSRSLLAPQLRSVAFNPAVAQGVETPRFSIERRFDPERDSTLADDVRRGLTQRQKAIPPKHFYDERGSRLFDAISRLPEYYLTRAEQTLLERVASDILAAARPTDLIELGSGVAKKTRTFLDAAERRGLRLRYHPIDVCEPVLRSSGKALLQRYPWLEIRAVVADYDGRLEPLALGEHRLVAFLGSSIGNFTPERAASFLGGIAAELRRGEYFLLGADLVKSIERLEAAYNDAAGITAAFNRNLLHVVNRELDADFDPAAFDHLAFYNRRRAQIEMHLRAQTAQRVTIRRLGLTVEFRAGETLHTEISRKFTRRRLGSMCRSAGFEPRRWYATPDGSFGLILAQRV